MESNFAWLYVIVSIFVAGVCGGIGGVFLRDDLSKTSNSPSGRGVAELDWWAVKKSITLGTLAAFVVPLFLELAAPGANQGVVAALMDPCSSSPTGTAACTKTSTWWSHLLVLVGFCIIASIWAQNFLETIGEKLLKEAKEEAAAARQEAEGARDDSQRALEQAERATADTREIAGMTTQAFSGLANQALDERAKRVLTAFLDHSSEYPTTQNLAELTQLDEVEVLESLRTLKDRGLVTEAETNVDAQTWELRNLGRIWLFDNVRLSEEERKLLRQFEVLPVRRPRPTQLANALKVPPDSVNRSLLRLQKMGLVAASTAEPGGFRLRTWGQVALRMQSRENRTPIDED